MRRIHPQAGKMVAVWFLQLNAPGEDHHRTTICFSRDKGTVLRRLRALVANMPEVRSPSDYFVARYFLSTKSARRELRNG